MKRRIAMLLSATALAASVAVFAPTSPASATVDDVCAGEGLATLTGAAFTYPVVGHLKLASFQFNFALGTCVTKLALNATGTVHGWCGFSVGEGVTGNGYYFQWQGVGGTLVLTGGVPGLLALRLYGVVNVEPNPIAGESCVSGADGFLVIGAVALTP